MTKESPPTKFQASLRLAGYQRGITLSDTPGLRSDRRTGLVARFDGGYDYASSQIAASPLFPPCDCVGGEGARAQQKRAALSIGVAAASDDAAPEVGGPRRAWGAGSGAVRSLDPQVPTLDYVDLPRGVSHVEREAGPPIPTRRDWRTPHPHAPGNRSFWGGADLSHKPGEPEVDWETSTDAEAKVPTRGRRGSRCTAQATPVAPRLFCCVPHVYGARQQCSRSLGTWEDKSRYGATEAGRDPSPSDGKRIRASFNGTPGVPF
jgi:hypothetical protein